MGISEIQAKEIFQEGPGDVLWMVSAGSSAHHAVYIGPAEIAEIENARSGCFSVGSKAVGGTSTPPSIQLVRGLALRPHRLPSSPPLSPATPIVHSFINLYACLILPPNSRLPPATTSKLPWISSTSKSCSPIHLLRHPTPAPRYLAPNT